MRNIRLFVSSPGDVVPERQRVQWIADRLNGEFADIVRFETVLWETSIFNAHEGGFQAQITKPADCDIVLTIFWSRLGTELHPSFPERMPDGGLYPSGTAFEVLSALEARKANQHRPDVYVFRKNVIPTLPINDKAAREDAELQWARLEDFFAHYFEPADKRVLRVVEKFRETGELERKVESLLRDWIRSNVSQGPIWSIAEKGSPFRGLEPFDAKHADVYCGRDRKVVRALDELLNAARRGKPFLLIPGASGSGKSSLMRAGMAPRLVRPGTVGNVDVWRIALMRPATDGNPVLALARALFVTGDEQSDDPGGFGKALPELADGVFKTPERLAKFFAGSTELGIDPIVDALDQVGRAETARLGFERPLRANLLLLVDQLEDVFAAGVRAEDRTLFAKLLETLVKSQRVWAIATLRGDMYERMITDRPFVVLKDICGQFDLGPPGPDELDEIVHRSASAADLHYEERTVKDGAGNERQERLDDRLLQDAAGENTLPLLQFALNLLFEKCWVQRKSRVLSISAYEEIGGLDGAINQTAEMALARLVRPGAGIAIPLSKEILDDIARTVNPVLEVLLRKLVIAVGREQQSADATASRALTGHPAPIAEARRNEASSRLIDVLVQARILLVSNGAQGASLRIAHDRVMSSWARAKALIEKNRDFYRVKESIENERQRWEEAGCSGEFLIPSGAPIIQAQEAVARYGEEFSGQTRAFVVASGRRARFRQRLQTAGTIVLAIFAVIASAASYYANQQRHRAIESYNTARDTVGRLATGIAQQLRDREGIRVETIDVALKQVEGLIDPLQAQNPGDPELKRIRADMHYEFAKDYQNSRSLPEALRQAEDGLKIRSELAALPAARREWHSEQAESLDQVGDIHREMARNLLQALQRRPKNAPGHEASNPTLVKAKQEFEIARPLFDQANEIRIRLHDEDTGNALWMDGRAQSLVRIGDLKLDADKDASGAKAAYRDALLFVIEAVRREPEHVKWQRNLSWALNKVGDSLLDGDSAAGLDMYDKALTIRRYIASREPTNTLYVRDVAFSLDRIAKAKHHARDLAGEKESLFEALELREELTGRDSSQKLWLIELVENLRQLGACMRDNAEFELAAGFFAMAAQSRPQLAADGRANAIREEASAEFESILPKIDAETRKHSGNPEALKVALKDLVTRKRADMLALRTRGRNQDPESGWKLVKETLLQAGSATLARAIDPREQLQNAKQR